MRINYTIEMQTQDKLYESELENSSIMLKLLEGVVADGIKRGWNVIKNNDLAGFDEQYLKSLPYEYVVTTHIIEDEALVEIAEIHTDGYPGDSDIDSYATCKGLLKRIYEDTLI